MGQAAARHVDCGLAVMKGRGTLAQANVEDHEGPELPLRGEPEPRRRLRGFAAMDPERRRRISSDGGKAAHLKGTAHEFDHDEARAAGRKGGKATAAAHATRDARAPGDASSVIPFPAPKHRE
jgi:hypothetical protein